MTEQSHIEAARGGDEEAFASLVRPHRDLLHAHCYRMLGSTPDAEDALQVTLLRAWRGLGGFGERSSLRSWLYAIATNVCLRALEHRPARTVPIEFGGATPPGDALAAPLSESAWVQPYPDRRFSVQDGLASPEARYEQRESVELAFIAVLQHLPPRQRAALVLRDVLGFSARETAEQLDTTAPSIESALQRARAAVEQRLPPRSQQAELRALGDAGLRAVVEQFVTAWEAADVDAIVGMLAEDAALTMPPIPTWFQGFEAIAGFLSAGPLRRAQWQVLAVSVNGQPGFAKYLAGEDGRFRAHSLSALTLADGRVSEFITFVDAALPPVFGAPEVIDG